MRVIDLTGKRFGRLCVLGRNPVGGYGQATWQCQCDCGAQIVVRGISLRNGHSKSCGCLRVDANLRHGHNRKRSRSRTYSVWSAMMQRCGNQKYSQYRDYGGRCITVCERWHSFENFLADIGEVPDGMTIGRLDNDGQYCKDNCRWETRKEQQRNTRRNAMLEFRSERRCLTEWAEITGIKPETIRARLRYGWGIDRALTVQVS